MSWGSAAASVRKPLPIGVLDRPGVFETLRVYAGRPAALAEHLKRLHESAHTAGIRIPSEKILAERLLAAVKKSGHSNAIARLSVHASASGAPVTLCSVRPYAGCPEAWYAEGVRIRTAAVRRPGPSASAAQVKGNDYLNAILAILNTPGADPLLLSAAGEVAETTVANLFILKGRALWTPPVGCGILLGVTRRLVLESARESGLAEQETAFTRHDLFNADEVWLTNAAVEVLPVTEADGRRIGGGRPGPWAERLRAAYRAKALPVF